MNKQILSLAQFEKFISKHDSVSKLLNIEFGHKVEFLSEVIFDDDEVNIFYKEKE